jgi:adenosylmethionine-8-amino-7-oxononanoate aminotransferase
MDLEFDRQNIWHPYTSLLKPLPVYPIVSAKGVRLQLENGKELIDGMSSWWTAIHGYNHPQLNEAATQQLGRMAHVMFGGITHEPAIALAKKLQTMTPTGLDKIFLCDSGSVSVEVAMKVAIQYQHALGKGHKTQFLTFEKGYHGDTTGAMSVCDPVSGMHHLFQSFMPQHLFTDAPDLGFDTPITKENHQKLTAFFEKNAKNAAAFIFEPIVQGAGGMRIYSPSYLLAIRALCDQYGILMIADEIATGFGRTGTLFAVDRVEVCPDIMCVGKALTGGYMTLAAMICSTRVGEVVCSGEAGVLMHGPTFMGNPLACAVANASLELLLASPWESRVQQIETCLKKELLPLITNDKVLDVRVLGAIGVLELKKSVDVAKLQAFFVSEGVWIRPFRNLIYIMPPYIIKEKDLLQLCRCMKKAIEL